MQIVNSKSEYSRWPHRLAVGLACATFPLLWVGGLVTTTKSGMAVPDWPNTYGYNLFLYPWQTWLLGPWDIFIEHGHRLFASAVGILTIALLIVLLRTEDRAWVRRFGFVLLALVIGQGVLGGVRVLLNERTFAMLHGCAGPLFFASTVAMAVVTSARWRAAGTSAAHDDASTTQLEQSAFGGNVRRLALVTAVFAYLQIVLGAVLRHVPVDAQPATFLHAVRMHLALAGILAVHILLVVSLILIYFRNVRPLGRYAAMLVGLLILQIALGAATWVVKFAVPAWAEGLVSTQQFTVEQGGWLQTHIITAHVATGSAILGTAVALALYSRRLLPAGTAVRSAAKSALGAAV